MSTEPATPQTPEDQLNTLETVITNWMRGGRLQLMVAALNAKTARNLEGVSSIDSLRLLDDQLTEATRFLPFLGTVEGRLLLADTGAWVLMTSIPLGGEWVVSRKIHRLSIAPTEQLQKMFGADELLLARVLDRLRKYGEEAGPALQAGHADLASLAADLVDFSMELSPATVA